EIVLRGAPEWHCLLEPAPSLGRQCDALGASAPGPDRDESLSSQRLQRAVQRSPLEDLFLRERRQGQRFFAIADGAEQRQLRGGEACGREMLVVDPGDRTGCAPERSG